MIELPSYSLLEQNYPNFDTKEEVYDLIGGKVKQNKFENSCVIRVSRALNYAGQPIKKSASANVVSGKDKKWYAYRVSEFIHYMSAEYGHPDIVATPPKHSPPTDKTNFLGKQGIIAFEVDSWSNATGHFDLWDEDKCVHADYFEVASRVLLWTAPA